MKSIPLLKLVEWISGSRVRLIFSTGRITEVELPVSSANARRACIVDMGMGLDPGDGKDMSAFGLYSRGRIIREGRGGVPSRV